MLFRSVKKGPRRALSSAADCQRRLGLAEQGNPCSRTSAPSPVPQHWLYRLICVLRNRSLPSSTCTSTQPSHPIVHLPADMAIELPLKVTPLPYPASCSASLKADGFGVVVEGVKDMNNISPGEFEQCASSFAQSPYRPPLIVARQDSQAPVHALARALPKRRPYPEIGRAHV